MEKEHVELTVAVRLSDGSVFKYKDSRHSGHLNPKELKQIERLANPSDEKWRILIQQLLKHRRSCTVHLIVGKEDCDGYKFVPIVETLIYRPLTPAVKSNSASKLKKGKTLWKKK